MQEGVGRIKLRHTVCTHGVIETARLRTARDQGSSLEFSFKIHHWLEYNSCTSYDQYSTVLYCRWAVVVATRDSTVYSVTAVLWCVVVQLIRDSVRDTMKDVRAEFITQ